MENTELDTHTEETPQDAGTPNNAVESPQEDSGFTLEGALEEIKKLRKEAASHRVKAKEVQDAKDALYAQMKELQTKLTQAEEEKKLLGIEVQLAGKVVDTKKALKLVDESYFADGQFQVDKFLEDNAFLKPQPAVNNTPLNKANNKPTEAEVTLHNYFDILEQRKKGRL